jgi:hypothetical protein
VKRKHQISIKYAALLATLVLSLYSITLPYHCHFTSNEKIIAEEPSALRWVFAFSCNSGQLIGAAYFQAAGD